MTRDGCSHIGLYALDSPYSSKAQVDLVFGSSSDKIPADVFLDRNGSVCFSNEFLTRFFELGSISALDFGRCSFSDEVAEMDFVEVLTHGSLDDGRCFV